MRVLILHDQVRPDARQDELDVLVQADFVRQALTDLGHQARVMPVGPDLTPVARALAPDAPERPDLCINLFESMLGSGRLIGVLPTLLDALAMPYTGCPAEAVFLSSGKLLTKRWLRAVGLPTPDWFEARDLLNDRPLAPDRWIVKSVWEHASVGLDEDSVVEAANTADLRHALERLRRRVGGEGFVERFIDGREFNIALLDEAPPVDESVTGAHADPQVLPPAEIEFRGYDADRPRVVGFNAKWVEDSFAYQHTFRRYDFPPSDATLLRRLGDLSLECWRRFDLRGYARVDFRVDDAGEPWVLEINANPCIAPDAGFMVAAERAGLTGPRVVDRLVRSALARASVAG